MVTMSVLGLDKIQLSRDGDDVVPSEQGDSNMITTADGVEVMEGDRVFNFYDGKWGVIGKVESDGWFDHIDESGKRTLLNGERVCKVIPRGNPFYGK